jgi:ABC-type nickel/cobalt efflux system permease component RcnA
MHQETLATAFLAVTAAVSVIFGKMLTLAITEAPAWMEHIVGPFGAVIVMTVAVVWFARRMDRAENREVERQKAREDLLERMTIANTRIADSLERNSEILDKVEQHFRDSH